MQSPPIEWALHVAHFGILDYLRDRGEPDGDTASECLRVIFHTHDPRGRAALAAAITASGVVLFRHLVK
ncbi:hypothetical protein FB382_004339 [Nocardioides ginsengisegetis]|uniref:Uncharacterized protein n=1 Tax=Nocardioides ginsengisegetis TaxID=661491 RepID=A0A7W3PC05_9ACTN|nr:hypothetical protein [Nocardioides ginsengisegetis]